MKTRSHNRGLGGLLPIRAWVAALACASALGFAVGARAQAPAADKPLIAVTIHPLADLVSQLVGESARVLTVVPPGASSHGMELPPATLAALANARLYIAIGKGIDHRLSQGVARALPGLPRIDAIDWVARQAPQPQQPLPQAPVTDKPAPGQPEPAHPKNAQHPGHPEHSEHGRHAEQTAPTPASSDRRASDHPADPKLAPAKENKHDRDPVHDPEHDHEHAPGQGDASRAANPHVWLDPVWARRFVASITPRLVEVLPGDRAGLEARSRQLDQRLADLHTEYSKALGSLAMRKLITYHDAFDVLAARYDLQVVGYIEPLVELRPGGELTPGRIVEIAKLVGGLGVPTLYYEPQFPRSAVDAIAARAGVGVMKLDPLGHPRVPGYEGYFQMMRSNLATLVKGQSASPKR